MLLKRGVAHFTNINFIFVFLTICHTTGILDALNNVRIDNWLLNTIFLIDLH